MDLAKAVERRDTGVVALPETRATSALVEDKGADRRVVFEVLDEAPVGRRHVCAHGEQERPRVVVLVADPHPRVESLEERALRCTPARELARLLAHAFINDALTRPPLPEKAARGDRRCSGRTSRGFSKEFP